MIDNQAIKDFVENLKNNVNELASERDSQRLWNECEVVEEPFTQFFGESTLSLWNRLQQATYYKALDTFIEALEITLLGETDE